MPVAAKSSVFGVLLLLVVAHLHGITAGEFDDEETPDVLREPSDQEDLSDGSIKEKRVLGGGSSASFHQSSFSKTSSIKGGAKSGPSTKRRSQPFEGGCVDRPAEPAHTTMSCNTYSGCRLSCWRGYEFPNGETRLIATCHDGEWQIGGTEWDIIPNCRPVCQPPCQNSGICVGPNTCNCSESFSGSRCQYEKRPCLNNYLLPQNSKMKCSSKSCTITCVSGHQFPDGSAITNLICRDGTWTPTRPEWTSVPDCQPVCNPPCQNGGNCLSFNTCQCPQDLRGPQCQYHKDTCAPRKLNFNGMYKCNGDRNSLTCRLTCSSGGRFSVPPAESYICQYNEGNFQPTPIPQCIYDSLIETIPTEKDFPGVINHGGGGIPTSNWTSIITTIPHEVDIIPSNGLVEELPIPGTCYIWSDHYVTFDGRLVSFQSNCSYTLVRDADDNTFSIVIEKNEYNRHSIKVFTADKEYKLTKNEGVPVLEVGSRQFTIPIQLSGVVVKYAAHFIEMSFSMAGISVLWDTESSFSINVQTNLWNKTAGLCGRIDGHPKNDLETKDGHLESRVIPFVNSWQVEELGEICPASPSDIHPCDTLSEERKKQGHDAKLFCEKLRTDPRFASCRKVVDVQPYFEACLWDYCACQENENRSNSNHCACQSISMFIRQCSYKGVTVTNWRDETMCPMECSGGRIYMVCNPESQATCGSYTDLSGSLPVMGKSNIHAPCIEGCYCPAGTVLHEQQCIDVDQCPCQLGGRKFPPGHSVPKDCNTCTCENGVWSCTQAKCTSRCAAIGDPHYVTFDGYRYDFMGKCSYYLVKGSNYSVETENVGCSGAISKNMGINSLYLEGSPSCTKSVTVRLHKHTIQLKQGRIVLFDGIEVPKLPTQLGGAYVHVVSSIFILVELPNGLIVWWDGGANVYVDAPPTLFGQTKGLCGTFTMNQKDDFMTPEGDTETGAIAFANKWKIEETCENEPQKPTSHPCDVNPHRKQSAEMYCKEITGSLFERCHWLVDPEPFYHDCLYDMCSCEMKISQCFCPVIAAYATECGRKKVHIEWRNVVRECGVHCPQGQQYQMCGSTCTHSCSDISNAPNCHSHCVEGCNCPEGQTLSDTTGECIPISECPCHYEGLEFLPGHKEVHTTSKGLQFCACENAKWKCRPATPKEAKEFPDYKKVKEKCSATRNEEFTTCEPAEPVTCRNMHNPPQSSSALCRAGCTCKKGYILDTESKRCIKPVNCPCHHGGRSYVEGNTIQEDCNTCKCKAGKWQCTERVCAGVCTAWGDQHFKTFDSRMYDFHGTCDYVLSKGYLNNDNKFDITIQNVQCGPEVTCAKSVTLRVGTGSYWESVTFTKDKIFNAVTRLDRIQVRTAGLFIFAEVPDLGIILQWDQGTRVYVKVDPKWKNKLKGLCGNYNDDMLDDFQTPSAGPAEVSSALFGDSWRLHTYCPESLNVTRNPCASNPGRKIWAMQKCGILKSSLFKPCHSEVLVEPYMDSCIFDTCACEMGGDCECLCTALAAYAHECNMHGVPIKWRSQNLCPMQCDEKCSSYSPCIDTCPKETCENHFIINSLTQLCKEDTCVEGCELRQCPEGHVYFNRTNFDCVPIASCNTICLEIGGVTYYEGDIIEQDDCHTCHCSRHEKSCTGKPCTEVTTLETTPQDFETECEDGWTQWINQNPGKKPFEIEQEPVPSQIVMNNLPNSTAHCKVLQMKNIECRVTGSHKTPKETGLDVECSLENGLLCKGTKCPDFEIRVLCVCASTKTTQKEDFVLETTPQPETCRTDKPNKPHEKDCHLFYHCVSRPGGPQFVEKTCGIHRMYNDDIQTCDWPSNVIAKWPHCSGIEPPSPTTTSIVQIQTVPSVCEPGDAWVSCGVRCDRVCLYYDYILTQRGYCKSEEDCVEGCVAEKWSGGCPNGYVWRDQKSCVAVADCTCHSHSGALVKPGQTYRESECEICQCVNNQYVCDTSKCETTTEFIMKGTSPTRPTPEGGAHHVETTAIPVVSPPLPCHENLFRPLIQGHQPLPDTAFTSSSYIRDYQPSFARIDRNNQSNPGERVWVPEKQNEKQYLQIDLGKVEPVYAVLMQGGKPGYITSYTVEYSNNNNFYYHVLDKNNVSQVFRGPINGKEGVLQKFSTPVEARYVRFKPQTWKNKIAMQVEIFGCHEEITSTSPSSIEYFTSTAMTVSSTYFIPYPTPSEVPECNDPMGLESGMMDLKQITMSSIKENNFGKYGPSQVHLGSSTDDYEKIRGAWLPALNDKDQWLQFDFLEPRNLTGFVTKGLEGADAWVEAFKVFYSHDGDLWNPVLDNKGRDMIFPGNYDDTSPQRNTFGRLLQARYIRIVPVKWHNHIAVRAEIHGCFIPYPPSLEVFSSTTETPVTRPPECSICPGLVLKVEQEELCRNCLPHLWWDGVTCVNETECPCFVGHLRYSVGTTYNTENCHKCICKLGGSSHCERKECLTTCGLDEYKTFNQKCECICKECDEGMILCPTSQICIPKDSWCNGVEDCPDDEKNCISTTTTPIPKIVTTTACPAVSCPPGTKPVKFSQKEHSKGMAFPFGKYYKKGGRKTHRPSVSGSECLPIKCVPIPPIEQPENNTCSQQICPPKFKRILAPGKSTSKCPEYICIPIHAYCNATLWTIDTFDDTPLKYDICNHILVKDASSVISKWNVSMSKNCSSGIVCSPYLTITQDRNTFNLYPDMKISLNGIEYTPHETKQLGGKYKPFVIYQVGDSLFYQSNRYGFWLMWNREGHVKIGVPGKLYKKVEGMCGTFNGDKSDDRTMPNKRIAKTTTEFGHSWKVSDDVICEIPACPIHLQEKAKEICSAVRKEPLSKCGSAIDLNQFVSRCMESSCTCLIASNETNDCHCQALRTFVADCQAAIDNVDLTGWRVQHGCLAKCPPPLVYQDCYHHKCEPSCGGMQELELCDNLPGTCLPGCYCPDGFLRHKDQCLSPDECRDCVCDGFGDPQYMTFDRSNFTFNGNCTYVASRDKHKTGNHTYQVLVNNQQCPDEPFSRCTQAVKIMYLNNTIHVQRSSELEDKKLIVWVNGKIVPKFPHKEATWLKIELFEGTEVTILVIPIQLEVSYFFHNYAFTVRLPSNIFDGKTEGLCGNCNKQKYDDFMTKNGTLTENPDEFGLSWLEAEPHESSCQVTPTEDCIPLPPLEDPCLRLFDSSVFEKCRNILDPSPYVKACQSVLCHSPNKTEVACKDMEAYVSDCERNGICLDWRSADLCPFNCPKGREYHACHSRCITTCDNLHEDKTNCTDVVPDGCYCPSGQVLHEEQCVDESKCQPCDDEGHYSGDSWNPDSCTSCVCEGIRKQCVQEVCPESTVCVDGMIPVEKPKQKNECCNKVICIPAPAPTVPTTCPTPKVPHCNDDQVPSSIVDADGCNTVVCKCKPCESEPVMSEADETFMHEPGIKLIEDNSGCCPKIIEVCDKESCPFPPSCSSPFISKEVTSKKDQCCPEHTCVPPSDSCLVKISGEIIAKKVGSVWQENACRSCSCKKLESDQPEVTCNNITCLPADMNTDIMKDYVIDSRTKSGECCPEIHRSACRVNETSLEIGKSLFEKHRDHCVTYYCQQSDDGSAYKKIEYQHCITDCKVGSEYIEPESNICCGECKPIGCVHDSLFHHQGTTWKSEDSCTNYTCISINGTFQIDAITKHCEALSLEVHEDFLVEEIRVDGECCKAPRYIACKYNGHIYEPGEDWTSEKDPCTKLSCERKIDGVLILKEITQTCSEVCSDGWGYTLPSPESRICCGHCQQIACTYNGTVHEVNSTWKSLDGCTDYECKISGTGQYEVIAMGKTCPAIDDCPLKDIYFDTCCKLCNKTAFSRTWECDVKILPPSDTKNLLKQRNGSHGECTNKELLNNFTECSGLCASGSKYNEESNLYNAKCLCCEPATYTPLNVLMTCEDGHTYNRVLSVPDSCNCGSCIATPYVEDVKSVKGVKGVKG